MLALGLWSGVTIAVWFLIRTMLSGNLRDAQKSFAQFCKVVHVRAQDNVTISKENAALKKGLEETILLYEITKEITKTMDEQKIFTSFRQQIDTYVTLKDCKFLKGDSDVSIYQNHTVFPLRLEKHTVGYLVAEGVSENDKEKFHILAQQFLLSVKRAILYEKLAELAITDTLTSVFTRRHYLERAQEEIEYAKKFNLPFAFLMLDIDHFKEYNDHYGHLVGDAILREVTKVMKENLRQIDLIGRYGGEEFSIILTQTTKEGARFAAERIRQSLESRTIRVYDENLKVTISIGIAVFPDDAMQLQELIDHSDTALYSAKNTGRNKVCMYRA